MGDVTQFVILSPPFRRLKNTQKQQQYLFATMGYLSGEIRGSMLKLRFCYLHSPGRLQSISYMFF